MPHRALLLLVVLLALSSSIQVALVDPPAPATPPGGSTTPPGGGTTPPGGGGATPVPGSLSIGVRPTLIGLTGQASRFWAEGGGAGVHTTQIVNAGVTTEHEYTPTLYSWDFGDGTTQSGSSAGIAWPGDSDIRHAWEAKGSYSVTLSVDYDVRSREQPSGGVWTAWQSEPAESATATISYPVQERWLVNE